MMFLIYRKKAKLVSKKYKRGSLQTRKIRFTPINRLKNIFKIRTSLFASEKASMTLEAALVLPIFLFLMFSFLLFVEVLCTQIHIGFTLSQISKDLSKYAYAYERIEYQSSDQESAFEHIPSNLFSHIYVKYQLEGEIGKNYLDASSIKNGSNGIYYVLSDFSQENDITDLVVNYEIDFPFPFFNFPSMPVIQRARTKGWTGYDKAGEKTTTEEMVYITTTGRVYHKSFNCTHINLSVEKINKSELVSLRNEQMGKYYSCEICGEINNITETVYITDMGNRYHNTLACSGLKRGISKIPISEVGGRSSCSRCGG